MTEVWWCAVHFSGYAIDPENHAEEGRICYKAALLDSHGCIGVPRRLVPVDALVIVREDGNWPIWFRAFVKSWWIKSQRSDYEGRWPREFMDALAKAVEDNPQ